MIKVQWSRINCSPSLLNSSNVAAIFNGHFLLSSATLHAGRTGKKPSALICYGALHWYYCYLLGNMILIGEQSSREYKIKSWSWPQAQQRSTDSLSERSGGNTYRIRRRQSRRKKQVKKLFRTSLYPYLSLFSCWMVIVDAKKKKKMITEQVFFCWKPLTWMHCISYCFKF